LLHLLEALPGEYSYSGIQLRQAAPVQESYRFYILPSYKTLVIELKKQNPEARLYFAFNGYSAQTANKGSFVRDQA
jgi:hypothetical protein